MRILVIGAGKMGQAHARAFAALPDVEVVGIASRSGDTAAKLAEEVGVRAHGSDWRELVNRTRPHGCIVAVTHSVNEELAADAIDADLHVLAEKPVAFSTAAVQRLADRARAKGVLAMAAVNRRYYRNVLAALDEIRYAGGLVGVTAFAPDPVRDRRARGQHAKFVYDRWTLAQTLHLIDLLRLAAGELVEVVGSAFTEIEGEKNLVAAMRFEKALVSYNAFSSSNGAWELQLHGVGASARIAPIEGGTFHIGSGPERALPLESNKAKAKQKSTEPVHKEGVLDQARAFADAIANGALTYPASSFADHAKSVALAETIERLVQS